MLFSKMLDAKHKQTVIKHASFGLNSSASAVTRTLYITELK